MDSDEFVKDVAKSSVLTPEEALDIVLHAKKSTPRNKVPFSDKFRAGTWQDQLFTCSYYNQYEEYYGFNENFHLQGPVEVKSVYYLIPIGYSNTNTSIRLDSINITRFKILENRQHCGQQLSEAMFDPPVKLGTGSHTMSINCGGGNQQLIQVTGQNTLQFRRATITMNSNIWNTIVGFKLKSSN